MPRHLPPNGASHWALIELNGASSRLSRIEQVERGHSVEENVEEKPALRNPGGDEKY